MENLNLTCLPSGSGVVVSVSGTVAELNCRAYRPVELNSDGVIHVLRQSYRVVVRDDGNITQAQIVQVDRVESVRVCDKVGSFARVVKEIVRARTANQNVVVRRAPKSIAAAARVNLIRLPVAAQISALRALCVINDDEIVVTVNTVGDDASAVPIVDAQSVSVKCEPRHNAAVIDDTAESHVLPIRLQGMFAVIAVGVNSHIRIAKGIVIGDAVELDGKPARVVRD